MTLASLEFMGYWDANVNEVLGSPITRGLRSYLSPGKVNNPQILYVLVGGNTNLDGVSNWQVGDWAVNWGFAWGKFAGPLIPAVTDAVETYLQSRPTDPPAQPGVIWWNGGVLSRS